MHLPLSKNKIAGEFKLELHFSYLKKLLKKRYSASINKNVICALSLLLSSSTSGYGAFMHPLGSVFLQTFCTLLQEEGHRDLELTSLMTRLSHRVAYTFQAKGRVLGGKKAIPCLMTRMTRDVFPFASLGKAGLSATSLVQTDGARVRTRSIS